MLAPLAAEGSFCYQVFNRIRLTSICKLIYLIELNFNLNDCNLDVFKYLVDKYLIEPFVMYNHNYFYY